MSRRERVSDLLESLDLPDAIVSLEQAKALCFPLVRANEKFNLIHGDATMSRWTPDGVLEPDPYDPGEKSAWEAGLEETHGLQAQAFIWRLSELFEIIPQWRGLEFKQEHCRSKSNGHATTVKRVLLTNGSWSESGWFSPQDKARALQAEAFLDDLPDLIAFHGPGTAWDRSSETSGLSLIQHLMAQGRQKMGEEAFAAWERMALDTHEPKADRLPRFAQPRI